MSNFALNSPAMRLAAAWYGKTPEFLAGFLPPGWYSEDALKRLAIEHESLAIERLADLQLQCASLDKSSSHWCEEWYKLFQEYSNVKKERDDLVAILEDLINAIAKANNEYDQIKVDFGNPTYATACEMLDKLKE